MNAHLLSSCARHPRWNSWQNTSLISMHVYMKVSWILFLLFLKLVTSFYAIFTYELLNDYVYFLKCFDENSEASYAALILCFEVYFRCAYCFLIIVPDLFYPLIRPHSYGR